MAGPALSPDELQGPGALSSAGYGSGRDNVYEGLMGMASALSGITNPDQARALTQQLVASQRAPVDQGTWSIHEFPNGQAAWINNKTRALMAIGNMGKPDQKEGEAEKQAARSARDQFDAMAKSGEGARAQRGELQAMRALVEDPEVPQGPISGNLIPLNQVVGAKGAEKQADMLRRSRSMELDLASRMKGAVSDYERKLSSQAQGLGPTQNKEANLRALDAYERLVEFQDAKSQHYLKFGNGAPVGDAWATESARFDKDWEATHPIKGSEKPANQNSFKSKSGKTINWSY
jgi:hypothetical protein